MTTMILDLDNWTAKGAVAELRRKTLSVRLSFDLRNAPAIPAIAFVGRGNVGMTMIPNLMAVEYSKTNNEPWKIVGLRVYGKITYDGPPEKGEDGVEEYRPDVAVNVYNHDKLGTATVPAWIRDGAIAGMPA